MKKGYLLIFMMLCAVMTGCGKSSDKPVENRPIEDIPVVAEKPVIYLYGYDNENVSVELNVDGVLTCTYPKYNEEKGWEIVAKKDSTIVDQNKNTYNYLYWEGKLNTEYDFSEGFCIKGSETASFLEKELKALGLNRKEANEFIIYWLPRMEKNNYNVIAFQTKAYTNAAKLEVVPKPDKTFRVFMAWYPSAEFVEMKEQGFKVPTRSMNEKILVEWGGTEVDSQTHKTLDQFDTASTASDEEIVAALAMKSQEQIQALLVQTVYKKQEVALVNTPAVPGAITPQIAATGHPFTDKNGASTTFTEDEWNRLKAIWNYTGNAEEMITHHTIDELRALLK